MPVDRRHFLKAAAAGAAASTLPARIYAQTPRKVTFMQAWLPDGSNMFIYAAKNRGLYKKRGIDLEISRGFGSVAASQAVGSGKFDFGMAAVAAGVQQTAKGLEVVHMGTAHYDSTMGIAVLADSPIKTPKDLEGKKVALTRIGLVMSILERMCKEYGCDVSKITLVNMAPQEIVLAFQRGEVDAIQTWEPWAIYATQQGGRVLMSATESFVQGREGKKRIDSVYAAVFAREDFVAKNPKTVQATLRGLKNAAEWLEANRDAAADIVAKDINIPKPIVLGTFAKTYNQVIMNADWAREFEEKAVYLAQLKELKRAPTAKDVIDVGPLKQVCPACVKGM